MQTAISRTMSTIYSDSQSSLLYKSSQQILSLAPANEEMTEYLEKLTTQAHEAAFSLACGSVLAGQSSEGDEFGDVAFWIGPGDYRQGNEIKVMQALQLSQPWASRKWDPLDLSSSTRLPKNIPCTNPKVSSLADSLKNLSGIYGFTVHGGPMSSGTVLYVLLGRFHDEGWAGLVGIGIQICED